MKLKIKLKPIPLTLASLLCASSLGAAVEPELMAKDAKNEAKAIPPAVKKLAAALPEPVVEPVIEPASVTSVNRDAVSLPTGTSIIKLALHEPVVQMPEITIGGKLKPMRKQTEKERYRLPQTTESITRERMDSAINLMVTEDAIKYMPSIQVRSRYIGDTNAPVGMRTSGTSASARNLIYADGILLSSLLGNNNINTGSPRWNTVSPGEIERIDILYGPFSAAYAGNSIGGVINITTKMPEKFEVGADAQASWQTFNLYGTKDTYQS